MAKSAKNTKQKNEHGTQHGGNANDRENRRASAEVTTLINAIAQENEADRKQQRGQNSVREWREWITLVLVLLAAVAAISQAIVLNFQLSEMRTGGQQVERAISAFQNIANGVPEGIQVLRDFTNDAKTRGQTPAVPAQAEIRKPNLSLTATVKSSLALASRTAGTQVLFSIRNDGQADTSVAIAANMILAEGIQSNLAGDQNVACREARLNGKEIKGSGGVVSETLLLSVKPDEFKRGVRAGKQTGSFFIFPTIETVQYISPVIVGCVQYGTEKDRHQIKFIGTIYKSSGDSRIAFKADTANIAADELAIEITVTSSN
jgi:hypothetical protein